MDRTQRIRRTFLFIGAGLLGLVLVYTLFLKPKPKASSGGGSSTTGSASATDASGNPVVEYIPTSTQYSNVAMNYAAGDVAQQTIPIGTPPPSSVVNTPPPPPTSGGGGTTPPVSTPPGITHPPGPVGPPTPKPGNPPTAGGAHVGVPPPPPRYKHYTIVGGDTLSRIAQRNGTTVANIYHLNQSTIDAWAHQHNYPISPHPEDNIFVGEPLLLP